MSMGMRELAARMAVTWREANRRADDMGVPPVDHFMGVSIPGLTHRLDDEADETMRASFTEPDASRLARR